MQDMLVSLLHLPSKEKLDSRISSLEKEGINIRRAMVPDMMGILDFVEKTAGRNARGECTVCFSRQPVSCFIAEKDKKVIGYACYEATMRDFFGPTEVLKSFQGKGIGAALLLACLHSMKDMGYAYAIIGGVGPADFYTKVCGAKLIENSDPGVYKDYLEL
jgi:GNAT superfamily N-acetyltransferase